MMLSSNALSVIVAAAAVASGKVAKWKSGRVAAKVSCNLCNKSSRQRVAVGSKLRAAAALKNCCENSQEKILSFPFLFFFFVFVFCCSTGHTLRASGGQKLRLLQLTTPLCYYVSRTQDSDPFRVRVGHQPSRGAHSVRLISRPCFACSCCPSAPALITPRAVANTFSNHKQNFISH